MWGHFHPKKAKRKNLDLTAATGGCLKNPLLKWYRFRLHWFTTPFSHGRAEISPAQRNNSTALRLIVQHLGESRGQGRRLRRGEKTWDARGVNQESETPPSRPSAGPFSASRECVWIRAHARRKNVFNKWAIDPAPTTRQLRVQTL